MTDEEMQKIFKEHLAKHRKAVRRDFFRRKAIFKKVDEFLLKTGVFTGGYRGGADGEQSVAGFKPGELQRPTPDPLPNTGANENSILISGRKAMPERDDGNKAQPDQLRPSSGAEALSDSSKSEQGKLPGAQPGQEQTPAQTREEERPECMRASVDK